MTGKGKSLLVLLILLVLSVSAFYFCFATETGKRFINSKLSKKEPAELEIFRKCYPDLTFDAAFDEEVSDWKITVTAPVFVNGKETKVRDFYWADGRLLPKEELSRKDRYWKMIYPYRHLKDPALMSGEEIERVRNFSSADNRRNGSGSPMFFFDFLYAAKSRIIIEDHIVNTTFLGKKTRVHERIDSILKQVEKEILLVAESDSTVKDFVASLKSADCYHWREIAGTGRKSFHTYGIAIDLLPKSLGGKAIFWSWTKDKDPDNWMLTPLSARWSPPQKVIDIFENHGFIWGGNWVIFDNMHFEFHPELLKN
jgi:hypothetical protein